jgi:hypothetical protein
MIMRPKKRSTAAARLTMTTCATLVGLAATTSAQSVQGQAQPLSVVTNENPAEPGAFTLTFGGLGLVSTSHITSTTYELSVDPFNKTAHFVSYLQHVDPLFLPDGSSTGDITVEVVKGSSRGFFDPLTRTFTTSELYAVHFTGDLSAFGLTSPVLLPSSSTGAVLVDPVSGGEITMDWIGAGELPNPFDASDPLEFDYHCAVNTVFPAEPVNVLGLSLTPDVMGLQLPTEIERRLVVHLDETVAQIQRGIVPAAIHGLQVFIHRVNLLSGWMIDTASADNLVTSALEIIDMLGTGGGSIGS